VPLTHVIFDLDNTLYPPSRGVVERVNVRINRFMVERLGFAPDVAADLRARYRDQHGTTLSGLMLHHDVQPDDYLEDVHTIAVEELLEADPALDAMLATIPQRKVVFTNGSAAHAERVLACLGVRARFADVFSLECVAYVPKPARAAFETVLAQLEVAASDCLFIDDRSDNLATARELGMRTILVGAGERADDDAAMASILELPALLAALG
jgi:putative hydrolase of the HAD superfamily